MTVISRSRALRTTSIYDHVPACGGVLRGIKEATCTIDDPFLGVHRMGHDVKEDFVFALKMVTKSPPLD